MPIHPQDLSDFIAMIGDSQPLPEGFEAEYEVWQNMNHRRGQLGPIGPLMVPLCRQFKLSPPASKSGKEAVLWRTVERNAQVLVTLNGVTKPGRFVGMGSYGEVEVVVEGTAWVQAVKPFQVELDLTVDKHTDMSLFYGRKEAPPIVDHFATDESLPAFNPEVIEDEELPPKMTDENWYTVEVGAELMVDLGDDMPDGKFLALGPADGEVSVEVDGEVLFVPEAKVTLA